MTTKTRETYPRNLYGGTPPHVKGSKTSRAAAKATKPNTVRGAILQLIVDAGERGMTASEVETAIQRPNQSVTARVRELELLEEIKKTDRTRKTRWGRDAVVYVATSKAFQLDLF